MAKPATEGSYKKGVSGNPKGRPPIKEEIVGLARAACPQAIAKLISLMEHHDPRVSSVACKEILDRGFGRPAQGVELSGKDGAPLQPLIYFGTRPPTT